MPGNGPVQLKRNADLKRLLQALGSWYVSHHRPLPFRKNVHWYTTLISEVMLQQTRVAAMLPAYERFLQRFPDVFSLASAAEEDVVQAWAGLGYYSRARNLHRAARKIVEVHEGKFPLDRKQALALPGIGPYTAAAVRSIALEMADPVVDGNVIRVLCRLFYSTQQDKEKQEGKGAVLASRSDVSKWAEEQKSARSKGQPNLEKAASEAAIQLMQASPLTPSIHNQSLMELGALVCTPGLPSCPVCPLQSFCSAAQSGGPALAAQIPPVKKQRKQDLDLMLYWIEWAGRLLIVRDPARPILRNDWLLPCLIQSHGDPVYSDDAVLERLKPVPETAAPGREKKDRWVAQSVAEQTPVYSLTPDAKLPGMHLPSEEAEHGPVFQHSIMHYRLKVRVIPKSWESFMAPPSRTGGAFKGREGQKEWLFVERGDLERYCPSSLLKKVNPEIGEDS